MVCVLRQKNCEEQQQQQQEGKAAAGGRNFLVFWFFGFAAFWSQFLSLFLSLSLFCLSLIISLFSGEKNTPTRIISLTRRACAEENSFQNCVLVVVINLSLPSSSLDSFFARGGVLEKKTSYVYLRRPHPALKNAFRTQTSAAAAATTDTATATVCGFDCSRSLGDIGRRETRRKTHSASMAWTKDMNENEEKIEVPEGLKLNAVRMVKTAYETCAKANNYQTKEKGQEEMPNVISEATAQQFVRERIEKRRQERQPKTKRVFESNSRGRETRVETHSFRLCRVQKSTGGRSDDAQ